MTEYDVIVIGGGPAGATAATLVAQYGHRVLLLERSPEGVTNVVASSRFGSSWARNQATRSSQAPASGPNGSS